LFLVEKSGKDRRPTFSEQFQNFLHQKNEPILTYSRTI